jgi:FixJ family two-component response regulator
VPSKNVPATLVYILDDDDSVRKGLQRLMKAAGIEARAFATAEEFLDAIGRQPVTCVLLDITMPRMTGPDVQARMRESGIDVPVIAVSARDDDRTLEMARTLGARFFLRKPVDDRALLDAIAWVNGARPGAG